MAEDEKHEKPNIYNVREAKMNWQPIETAPKDGVLVDLWHKGGFRVAEVWWDKDDACWSCSMDDLDFTHWMPLPPPPKDEA